MHADSISVIDSIGSIAQARGLHILCNLEGIVLTSKLLHMANSDASSAPLNTTVRVLVSFFLAAADETSSARSAAIHKEKFNVPLSDEHKDLYRFQKHLRTFTGLEAIARSKGLGENPEVTIARVQKAGSGVDSFSLRTQDAWQYEFDTLIRGNGMLQGTNYAIMQYKRV